MAFRLLFWRRPKPESAGRHVRATALPVPDSTGALASPLPPVERPAERGTDELGSRGLETQGLETQGLERQGLERQGLETQGLGTPRLGMDGFGTGERTGVEQDVDLDATAPVPVVVTPVRACADDLLAEEAPLVEALTEVPALVEALPVEALPAEPVPVEPVPVEAPPVEVLALAPVPVEPVSVVAGVALGFADGASVELHPDDPRVTSFRAAAAALLDAHEA